jgi:F-box and leucine-rich repeat protein 5
MSKTDFCSNGALETLLESLATTFYEFKTHEYIENQFIMERLKQRLKMVNASSQAVCNCHGDSRLVEVCTLVNAKASLTEMVMWFVLIGFRF